MYTHFILSLGQSRDLFRVTGALSYILDLLYSTTSTCVQQAILYTLGCATEKNGTTQNSIIPEGGEILEPRPLTHSQLFSIACYR